MSEVSSTPMSRRIGSGVNTIASTFSIRMSSPSEAMNRLVRKAPRRSSCWYSSRSISSPAAAAARMARDHRHAQRQVQQLLPDIGEVGRQREHRAVRHMEVQRGAVDQAPAERAQRVQAAHHQAGGEQLEQEIHANVPATL